VAYLSTNFGVLLLAFYFIVHTACYCMDAMRLGGNEWINYLYTLVIVSCESMTVQPSVWGRVRCGYWHNYMFNHVFIKVLNYGYICRVAVILKYMHRGMYVWRVFSLLLYLCALLGKLLG
jgi:hypothetical protein